MWYLVIHFVEKMHHDTRQNSSKEGYNFFYDVWVLDKLGQVDDHRDYKGNDDFDFKLDCQC